MTTQIPGARPGDFSFAAKTANELDKMSDPAVRAQYLAFAQLRQLHAIKSILAWTLVVIPAVLLVLTVILAVATKSAVSPTGGGY
jgi:hypothetical protein